MREISSDNAVTKRMRLSGWWVFAILVSATALICLLGWQQLPIVLQSVAILLFTMLLPGALLVEALVGRGAAPPTPLERGVLFIGAGYGVMILTMLALSYLPGGVATWQTLLAFAATNGVLALSCLAGQRVSAAAVNSADPQHTASASSQSPFSALHPWTASSQQLWIVATFGLLLLLAGFLRFTHLGYAEFHNDEARAALRAAGVIQGYEDVLLIHRKGPAEILVPTVLYSLSGALTEATARLPLAVANLAGLVTVVLLGWRLFGPGVIGWITGFAAAFLLALDGYFIGFARIVQYQSIVFLTSALVVLVLHRLAQRPTAAARYLMLAAFLLATGLLSHYEAAMAALPAAFLWGVAYWQHPQQRRALLLGTGIGLLVGIGLLALFYGPYLLHPQFTATYTYLTERRIGGTGLPYNNLGDVFQRTTLYSTTYYVALLGLTTLAALFRVYQRGLGRRAGLLVGGIVAALLLIVVTRPEWFLIGGRDWTAILFVLAIGATWVLPGTRWQERLLWLWFGAPFLLALFFTLKPRTHVYIFFTPWLLLVGLTWARGWVALARRMGTRPATVAGVAVATCLVLLFGNYAYWYFVHNDPEILRTWEQNRPAGYWTTYAEPDKRALFGFPSNNGWKVVGALYQQGEIAGKYETNELEAWGPAWYTRGQTHCKWEADWYFQTTGNLEPFYDFQRVAMEDFLSKGFEPWGVVTVQGEPKMTIHQRTDTPPAEVQTFALEEYAPFFDENARPDLSLGYPEVNPPIQHPLHVNFADLFWLEGYTIHHPDPLQPGDTIELTLFWRAQQATDETHKVFVQSFYGNGTMVAQRDAYPVCGTRDTWQWDPGELIADVHQVPVKPDAPDGLYPLYVGMYPEQSGSRLDVLDEAGNVTADWVHLTDIRIGEE